MLIIANYLAKTTNNLFSLDLTYSSGLEKIILTQQWLLFSLRNYINSEQDYLIKIRRHSFIAFHSSNVLRKIYNLFSIFPSNIKANTDLQIGTLEGYFILSLVCQKYTI